METKEIISSSTQKEIFLLVFMEPFKEGMWEMETQLHSFSAEVKWSNSALAVLPVAKEPEVPAEQSAAWALEQM